jgi:hypothetical protein
MPDYTNCIGPSYTIKQSVSKKRLSKIANELDAAFGDGYVFEPEKITEGGFVMTKYPDKLSSGYKSIRLGWVTSYSRLYEKIPYYPYVPVDWKDQWREDVEIIYPSFDDSLLAWRNKQKHVPERILYAVQRSRPELFSPTAHTTALKSFCGAPIWTEQEIVKVFEVFEKNGWIHHKHGAQKKIMKSNTRLCNKDDGSWMSIVNTSK